MLRTGQSRRAPPRRRDLARRRGPRYRGPWRLPGPDSHRLAAVSLSLGYVVGALLSVVLGARAAGRTFRRNRGADLGGVLAAGRPAAGRPGGRRGRRPAPPGGQMAWAMTARRRRWVHMTPSLLGEDQGRWNAASPATIAAGEDSRPYGGLRKSSATVRRQGTV